MLPDSKKLWRLVIAVFIAVLLGASSLSADVAFSGRKGLAGNSQFLIQVEVAMVKVATDIAGEAPASPANIPLDDKRHALTVNVFADTTTWRRRFADTAAFSNSSLTTASTDADVEFTVSSIWNDLAGVTGAEAGL